MLRVLSLALNAKYLRMYNTGTSNWAWLYKTRAMDTIPGRLLQTHVVPPICLKPTPSTHINIQPNSHGRKWICPWNSKVTPKETRQACATARKPQEYYSLSYNIFLVGGYYSCGFSLFFVFFTVKPQLFLFLWKFRFLMNYPKHIEKSLSQSFREVIIK